MLEIQQIFEIKNCLCVPKAQITFILSCVKDIAIGINLAIHGLLNFRLKPTVE